MTQEEELGAHTESRFFNALSKRTPETPAWFVRVSKTTKFFDKRGIDAFVQVHIEGQRSLRRIPIQIKTSIGGKEEYFAKHPLCYLYNVVVVVVEPHLTFDQIRTRTYRLVEEVRSANIHYTDLLRQLAAS